MSEKMHISPNCIRENYRKKLASNFYRTYGSIDYNSLTTSFRLSERSVASEANGEISPLRPGIAVERGRFFDPSALLRAGFRAKNRHSAQNDEQDDDFINQSDR
jgi:hypothetical protein